MRWLSYSHKVTLWFNTLFHFFNDGPVKVGPYVSNNLKTHHWSFVAIWEWIIFTKFHTETVSSPMTGTPTFPFPRIRGRWRGRNYTWQLYQTRIHSTIHSRRRSWWMSVYRRDAGRTSLLPSPRTYSDKVLEVDYFQKNLSIVYYTCLTF